MKKDEDEISLIWSSYVDFNNDYLHLENVDNFDWDLFFDRYDFKKFYLAEAFSFKGSNQLATGTQFIYQITTSQNSTFDVILNWIECSHKTSDEMMNYMFSKSRQPEDEEKFKTVYELTKNNQNKKQLFVYFKNENNQTHLTNSTKENESFVVFKSLENSLKHFYVSEPKRVEETLIIKFMILKSEPRRLDLYQKIWKRFEFLQKFQNILIDKFSIPNYFLVTLY